MVHHSISLTRVKHLTDESGLCLQCGEEAQVSHDARGFICEDCGCKRVYGTQELIAMLAS